MTPSKNLVATTGLLVFCATSQAQWGAFTNQSITRMVINQADIAGDAIQLGNDVHEKDYSWGDIDNDGDSDLVCMRKFWLSNPGGKRALLFMNENGVLVDRTSTLAVDSLGVPAIQGVSQGFLDNTNTRQQNLVDVNNDGWLDLVTTTTIGDVNMDGSPNMLPQYLGHPRVYMNKGSVSGVWQGLRYEYARFPQLLTHAATPIFTNPRFCSVAAGDINGDGYVDLYMADYDTGEVGPGEPSGHDLNNRLFMNQGAANPGFFTDESLSRMGANFTYPGDGTHNLLWATFGGHTLIDDMNGDGRKDVLKLNTLTGYNHIASMTTPTSAIYATVNYKAIYAVAGYSMSTADLNGDGRVDMVISDDGQDRYLLNSGNDGNSNPNFTTTLLSSAIGNEAAFSGMSTLADLDNDNWIDAVISDVDIDTTGCIRRTRLYRNQGNAPNVTISETSPSVIPVGDLNGVYNVAILDINGDSWKDIILGKCNGTQVWMQTAKGTLAITYRGGKPATLVPNTATNFQVQIVGVNGGTVLNGSPRIFVSTNGGAFAQTFLTALGGNLYQATIPATPCGSSVRYYLAATLATGGVTIVDPASATYGGTTPKSHYNAVAQTAATNLLTEYFESGGPGWTVTNDGSLTGGAWELATPNGTWNEGVKAAPDADSTGGAGVNCYVTQNGVPGDALGAADVDGGSTHLLSPTFDLSGGNGRITYSRWFYSSTRNDVLQVSVSNNNGGSWVTVANHPMQVQPNFTGSGEIKKTIWINETFLVGDYVSPTNQVKVRFSVNDATPAGFVEAGIDDFTIDRSQCSVPCPADCALPANGFVNVDDLLAVINTWGICPPPCPTDIAPPPSGNGFINVDDLLGVINAWGQCP